MESPRGGREEAAGLGQAGAVGGERKGQEITPGSRGPGEGKMLRCKQCAVNVETPRAAATDGPAHPTLRPSCLLLLPMAGLRRPQIVPPPLQHPEPSAQGFALSPAPCRHALPGTRVPLWHPCPPPASLRRREVGCCGSPPDAVSQQAGEGREGPRLREHFASRHPLPRLSLFQPKLLLECRAVAFGPCPPAMAEQSHARSGAGGWLHITPPELCAAHLFPAFCSWGAHPRAPTRPPRMLTVPLPAPTSCCPPAQSRGGHQG